MIWSIRQFPELEHLSDEQRELLLKRVPFGFTIRVLIKSTVMGTIVIGLVRSLFASIFSPAFSAYMFLIVPVLAIWIYLNLLRDTRRQLRTEVARAFAGERLPFCLNCGYDFQGLHSDKCPECGSAAISQYQPADKDVTTVISKNG